MASFPPHVMNPSHHNLPLAPWPYPPEQLLNTPYLTATHAPAFAMAPPPPTALQRSQSEILMPKQKPQFGLLKFRNKPQTMADRTTWTPQELTDARRIVAFRTYHIRDSIHVECFPLPQDQYSENLFTISCVYCIPHPLTGGAASRYPDILGKCIFTSVDIIMLLEKIVEGPPFDVQEKNRIRRNLEGYHPATIKKEGDTIHFFNQLMSYSQPKTRNIEKDIKVFNWDCIDRAMKAIFTKYSKTRDRSTSLPSPGPRVAVPHLGPFARGVEGSQMGLVGASQESVDEPQDGEYGILGVEEFGVLASSSEGLDGYDPTWMVSQRL